jgi:V/A-type H+-transporting ATPase subunit I
MFRPERMTSTSIFCLRKDVDNALEALNHFGQFHLEEATETSTQADYNRAIQKVEADLVNVNATVSQLGTEKSGFLDIFKAEQPSVTELASKNWQSLAETVSSEISQLKAETEGLVATQKSIRENTAHLCHLQDMLAMMKNVKADFQAMEELRLTTAKIACLPRKNLPALSRDLKHFPMFFHACYLDKSYSFLCMAFPTKYRGEIEKILKTQHAEIFEIPPELPHDVSQALKVVNRSLTENAEKEKSAGASLQQLAELNKNKLVALRETAQNLLALLLGKRKILQSGRLATIQGFVPRKNIHVLREKIEADLNGNVLVLENEVSVDADPPTMIRHSRFVKPFEEITKLYGVPHYDELDPTPVIAFTFPLLFGLMFGDMGHGLMFLVGGATVALLIKNHEGIRNFCWILAACGVGAIFAGALFGEFFGLEVFAPLWFNPFDNVLEFLFFSLFVGVFQIVSGLVLEMANFLLKRNVVDAVLTSVPKIAFYVGSVYLIAVYQLDFGAWLAGSVLVVLVPFVVLVLGKSVLSLLSRTRRSIGGQNGGLSLAERFFESSDFVTRLLSNTMSYARILALLMAHWALVLATYTVSGLIGSSNVVGVVLSGLVIVLGNLFVIALEGLIVFIHALRLHFYEWFNKFYQGTGTPFSPFKQNFVHTKVLLGKRTVET